MAIHFYPLMETLFRIDLLCYEKRHAPPMLSGPLAGRCGEGTAIFFLSFPAFFPFPPCLFSIQKLAEDGAAVGLEKIGYFLHGAMRLNGFAEKVPFHMGHNVLGLPLPGTALMVWRRMACVAGVATIGPEA